EWLVRHRPKYLLTFPSVAQDLASHPDAKRTTDLGLKGVIAISEVVSDDARELVRKTFGCEVAQIYGCSEMGAVALQSPDDGTLLVCEENVMVELLDDDDQPVAPGKTGRVILTSLYNFATPFIRYDIGESRGTRELFRKPARAPADAHALGRRCNAADGRRQIRAHHFSGRGLNSPARSKQTAADRRRPCCSASDCAGSAASTTRRPQ